MEAKLNPNDQDDWPDIVEGCIFTHKAICEEFEINLQTFRSWIREDECRLKRVKLFPRMRIIFYMPMPKSLSEKKKKEMDGTPHQKKCDVDNLIKGLLDILPEDSHIWDIHATKVWSRTGKIFIRELVVYRLEDSYAE